MPEFQAIQASLHTLIPQAKLTALEKVHLTLAFLGEQIADLKPQLVRVIEAAVTDIAPFEVTPAYIDGFPTIHHPQVLWVGVKGDVDKIFLIREGIKDGLESFHLPVDERRFIPHISIAKLNNSFPLDRDLEIRLEKIMTVRFDPISVSSIKLFESIPTNSFHKHNTLAEISLA